MLEATRQACENCDVLVMAAAVADFRPLVISDHKIKKENGAPRIEFEFTPDILMEISRNRGESGYPKKIIGFAAESRDLVENASKKMQLKNLDMIVANDIGSSTTGFEVDDNQVSFLYPDGKIEPFPVLTKYEVAEKIINNIINW
jgi:phosphopantothenoylcysteine decarboxylase/phosphopantothenate--cysteine ligase